MSLPTIKAIETESKSATDRIFPKAMLGNEALGLGMKDAGIKFFTSYPGTPSTEIMDTLFSFSKSDNLSVAWSTNEAVALEEAIATSIIGIDSAFICKSVGINVAMDALMTIANSGTNAGLVIIIADDPNMLSSQNEQDNRLLAIYASLPIFEPASVQECYDLPREALKISRKFKIPVIIRSVTRISHALGIVNPSTAMPLPTLNYKLDKNRFVNIPANARKNHQRIIQIREQLRDYVFVQKYWNEIVVGSNPKTLFISSGASVNYLKDALEDLDIGALIFQPLLINPFPETRLLVLLKQFQKIAIVEELEPYLEIIVRTIVQKSKLNLEVLGKEELGILKNGELTVDKLSNVLSKKFGVEYESPKVIDSSVNDLLINRPPVLCAGCPHRATYVLLNEVMKRYNPVYCNDIGCYSLGVLPPHNTADMLICMGASIPMATSIALTQNDKYGVAIIGDSTFWHSGLSGLVNAIWKDANILIVVMDNFSTAMTGNQENPSVKKKLDIIKTAEVMGATVRKINPMDYKQSKIVLKELLKSDGVKVLVSQYPCALSFNRKMASTFSNPTVALIKTELCNGCGFCVEKIGCPAFTFNKEKGVPVIDNNICNGCMYCSDHCYYHAIKEVVLR